jgi:hypothetical protein
MMGFIANSVVAFSWVLDEDDYEGNCEGHVTTHERKVFVL